MRDFFRPAPDAPPVPAALVARAGKRWRWSVFLSITIGYTIFYVTRLGTAASRDAMIASDAISVTGIGIVDSVFLVTYAVGKTLNGFLADRVSARRFFATALLVSAAMNLVFGLSSMFAVFVGAWAVNGWVQSVGVPTSGVVMARWFAPHELGTRYSMWSMAHHLGEGLTFIVSTRVVGAAADVGLGVDAWRAAFVAPALLAIVAAVVLFRTLADRPQAVGLPAVAPERASGALGALQLGVLRDPAILVCGVASGLVYVTRYAINNWGVFYLREELGLSREDAGATLSIFPIAGIAGTLLAGPISDRLAGGRRVPVAVGYGVMFCVALAVFFDGSAIRVPLACAGFAMGGLLVFLGGLLALELCDRRTAGAALGVIGGLSYLGAAIQSLGSSYAIAAGKTGDHYDFTLAKWLWLGAPCLAVVLTCTLWRVERVRAARS